MKKRIVKLFKIYMILFLCLQVLFPLHIKAVTYDDELYTEFYLNTMQAHGFNPEDTDKFYVEDVNSPNNGYSIYQNKSNLRLTGDKDITFMDCSGGTFQVFVNGERVLLNPPYDVNDPIYETNYYGGEFSIHTIDSSTAADKQDYSSPYYEKEFTAQIHKGIKIDEYGEVLEDYALEITRNPANMASMNRYKVTYEANGGKTDWNTPIYYEVGEDGVVHNGVGFISQGRTIESWNTEPDGTGERYDLGEETAFDKGGTAPQKDEEITLYAQWKASYYQIHFDANGMTWKDNAYDDNGFEHVEGESVDFSSKTVYGTNPSTDQKQAPSLDFDYTFNYPDGNDIFVGWSTSKNGKAVILQPNDFGEIDVSQLGLQLGDAITLYAIFSGQNSNTYDIEYNANGGSGTESGHVGVQIGDQVTLSDGKSLTYTNHRLLGWSTNAQDKTPQYTLGSKTDFNAIAQAGQKITLYAIWEEIYTLKYDTSSATSGSVADKSDIGVSESVTLDDGSSIKKDGYDFVGWATTNNASNPDYIGGSSQILTPSGGSITLYPVWKQHTYTIQYDLNHGVSSSVIHNQVVGLNDKVSITGIKPTREGYKFKGWSQTQRDSCDLISVCDAEYVANQELINGIPNASKDQTYILYAVWQPIQYYILFEGNTANSGNMGEMLVTYDKVEKLDKNTYQKTGYHFIGWNTQANGSGLSYLDETTVKNLSSLQGDIVSLYAQWSPNHYKVEFDANGGVGSIPVLDMVYDKEKALPSNTLYKGGYIFKGWSTSRNGNIVYQDKESIKNLTTQQNDVVKLYAIWEAIPSYTYIIRYDANGGNGDSFEHVVEVGKDVVIDDGKKFSKENHTFIGWSTVAKVNDFYRPGDIYKDLAPAGHTITLYAQWSKNTVDDSPNKPSTDGNESTEDQPNHPNTDENGSTEEQPNYPNTDENGSAEEQPNKPNTDAGIGITPNKPTIGGNGIDSQTNGTYEDEKYHNGDNEFTITFVTNDGSYVNTMKVEVGDYIILPDLQDTEPGYVFIGWSTSKNGEVMYKPNQHVYFQDKDNVVLYAQYERISNNVGKQEHGVNTADHTSYYKYIGAFIVSFIVVCMLIYKKLSIK